MKISQVATSCSLYGAVPPINSGQQYSFNDPNTDPNSMVMYAGGDEMLRVSKDGFWVRGVKVSQDDKEAEIVYNAFLQWMSYMALTRSY